MPRGGITSTQLHKSASSRPLMVSLSNHAPTPEPTALRRAQGEREAVSAPREPLVLSASPRPRQLPAPVRGELVEPPLEITTRPVLPSGPGSLSPLSQSRKQRFVARHPGKYPRATRFRSLQTRHRKVSRLALLPAEHRQFNRSTGLCFVWRCLELVYQLGYRRPAGAHQASERGLARRTHRLCLETG